jgi:hypothetical protein
LKLNLDGFVCREPIMLNQAAFWYIKDLFNCLYCETVTTKTVFYERPWKENMFPKWFGSKGYFDEFWAKSAEKNIITKSPEQKSRQRLTTSSRSIYILGAHTMIFPKFPKFPRFSPITHWKRIKAIRTTSNWLWLPGFSSSIERFYCSFILHVKSLNPGSDGFQMELFRNNDGWHWD